MARYKLVSGKDEWRLSPGSNLIGHFGHCPVHVDGPGVAGEHARIDLQDDRLLLTDLGSDAGTFVSDARVEGAVPLVPGSTFRVAGVGFRVVRGTDVRQWIRSPAARRVARRAAKAALVLLAGLVVFLVALPLLYDAESFRRETVEALEAALSRDAEIGGVEFKLFRGRTELTDVVVHNLPEFGSEPLVRVPEVRVRFHTGRYLGSLGRSLRAEVELERPTVMLERNDRGRSNVDDLFRAVARAVGEAGEDFVWRAPYSRLELHIRAVDGTVRVRDDLVGESREMTGVTLEADLPSLDGELSYRLAVEVPVAGRPGRIEATGRLSLFEGGRLSSGSVKGKLLAVRVEGLDPRAIPWLPPNGGVPLPGGPPTGAVDLDFSLSAESLRSARARLRGRLSGGGAPAAADATFSADLAGSLLPAAVERGEVSARGPGWDLTCQGRIIPCRKEGAWSPAGGAEALDLDATLRADVSLLDALRRRVPLLSAAPLDGRLVLKLSTTGPTRALDVVADLRLEGLACPGTGALPEDVSLSLRGTAGLLGWTTLDGLGLNSLAAEASFLQASVAPGEVSSITRPEEARGRLGPIEFDVDLAELGHRYGPAFAFRPPDARVHGWAELSGEGGRLVLRHAAYSRGGSKAEGTTALVLAQAARPRAEVEWRFSEPAGLAIDFRGGTDLAREEPRFDLALSASGGLARVLEVVRPYLGATGSVWARGRFALENVRVSGTPSAFSTNGRLELLEPELWGGDPTAPPFSESRFNAIWNLDFGLPGGARGPVRLRANLFKGSSSTLHFSLDGEVEDLARGLGRYELRAFADLDRIGSALKKLAIVPAGAAIRGTMDVELSADTRRGDIRLTKLELDTPFVEAKGGGEVARLPLPLFLGKAVGGPGAPAPETTSGNLRLSARLDVDELGRLARAFRPGGSEGAPAAVGAEGEVWLDLAAEGAGDELLVSCGVDLDDFVGRLGRHVRKAAGELASLRVSASIASGKPDLVTLRSGVLTLGRAGSKAKFELSGRLARGLDGFELAARSEGFDMAPVARLLPNIARGAAGEGDLDLRARGRLAGGALVPGSLELGGVVTLRGADIRFVGSPEVGMGADGTLVLAGRELSARDLRLALRARPPGGALGLADLGTIRFEKLGVGLSATPPGVLGTFDARSEDLDLGVLFAALRAGAEDAGGAPRAGPTVPRVFRFDGRVAVDRASVWPGRAVARKLACGVELADGALVLKDAVAELWGGVLSGQAVADLSGGRPRLSGRLVLDEIDLVEAAKAAGIPGALEGTGGVSLEFEGEGLGRLDFERNWQLNMEGRTADVTITTGRWPLAREVRAALEKAVGIGPRPAGKARSKPVTVRVAVRRGRTTMESTDFEFDDGLRLGVSGRTELDGRIAVWVAVGRLPDGAEGVADARRGAVEDLVRREALRFAVTGTWARPAVDVEGLLRWILPAARDEGPAGGDDARSPAP